MNRLLACALLTFASFAVIAQDARKPISNADVLSMTKSGLGEQTIVLAIQHGPTAFDTSPQALVELKKAGVPDGVLNCMLTAATVTSTAAPATVLTPDPSKLLDHEIGRASCRERVYNSVPA